MWKTIVIAIATLLILQHILTIVYMMGFHKRVYQHYPGPCRIIPGIDSGSEDIALLSSGLAFISSGLNPMHMGFIMDPEILAYTGNIYLFDFNQPEKDVTKLKLTGKIFDTKTFSAHGISVYEDKKTGAVTLFVVNHRRDVEVIEVFQFDQQALTLRHKKSVFDPNFMKSVNDVVAISQDSFYFTNDGEATSFLARTVENLLMLARGSVIYYDGQTMRKVVDRGFGCNGINASPDNKYLYVSQPAAMTVNVYERKADSSLRLAQVLDLGTIPDNIFVEPDTGNLWIGCHAILHKMQEHFQNKTMPAPSQVLHIKWDADWPLKYTLSEVFADGGEFLTASTIGVHRNGGLLIGTTTTKLAYCQVNSF